ncbi:MAG TPA: sigma factor, partial [Dongiaceae bacterium]|nr:sigma factor [Dongiaceae bacterium]
MAVGRSTGEPAEDPDLELVRQVGAGDQRACAALVDRHLPKVLGLAGRLLGNRADAEEVAQEVFLRVWRHAGEWRA